MAGKTKNLPRLFLYAFIILAVLTPSFFAGAVLPVSREASDFTYISSVFNDRMCGQPDGSAENLEAFFALTPAFTGKSNHLGGRTGAAAEIGRSYLTQTDGFNCFLRPESVLFNQVLNIIYTLHEQDGMK